MVESVFDKSPDIEGQITPGPTVPFKLVTFPDLKLGQTFVLYDSDGAPLCTVANPANVAIVGTVPISGTVTASPGIATTVTESSYAVTTSNTTALAANASRTGGYIQNISDTDMYISFGGTANLTTKTYLQSGGNLPLVITGLVYRGAIKAIHGGTGTKTLAIVEVT